MITTETPRAAALTDTIMEQAQVYASAWSLIGGPFDYGNALETAEHEKAELRTLVGKTIATLDQPAAAPIPQLCGSCGNYVAIEADHEEWCSYLGWKKRALDAEALNRKFMESVNGPTYMGDPVIPAPSPADERAAPCNIVSHPDELVSMTITQYAELQRASAMLDWLEHQIRQRGMQGVSFDWVPSVDGESSGYRYMRRHFIAEPKKTLRAAIDEAQRSEK